MRALPLIPVQLGDYPETRSALLPCRLSTMMVCSRRPPGPGREARLATVDVLVIDDFTLETMSREESRDIYQLFVERNARCSTVVTSN